MWHNLHRLIQYSVKSLNKLFKKKKTLLVINNTSVMYITEEIGHSYKKNEEQIIYHENNKIA